LLEADMTRTLQRFILGLVVAATAQAVSAQQAPPGPPAPTAEHKRMGYFVGKWTSEGELKPGPMGPGGKMTGTDDCQWFQGGFSVVCHSDGKTPMGPMKSMGIIGYSAEEKVYTYYGTDSMGMNMTSVARGTRQGDTWTYTDESTMGGQKYKSRITLKELSPTKYTFKMEIQGPDGKWAPMMDATSTKK
jgi:hypothetical protein